MTGNSSALSSYADLLLIGLKRLPKTNLLSQRLHISRRFQLTDNQQTITA